MLFLVGSHDNRNDDIIDPTHKGPVQVYVAPTSSNGAGAVWVKLFSEGFTSDWVSLDMKMPWMLSSLSTHTGNQQTHR